MILPYDTSLSCAAICFVYDYVVKEGKLYLFLTPSFRECKIEAKARFWMVIRSIDN